MSGDAHAIALLKAWRRENREDPVPPMPDGCNPVERAPLRLCDVEDVRRINCRRYTGCLNYAAGLNWGGFSCESCDVRDEVETETVTRQSTNEEAGMPE